VSRVCTSLSSSRGFHDNATYGSIPGVATPGSLATVSFHSASPDVISSWNVLCVFSAMYSLESRCMYYAREYISVVSRRPVSVLHANLKPRFLS